MQIAFDLLKKGVVTAIASDCHNIAYRPPNLAVGLERAVELVGEKLANSMVTTIPKQILPKNNGSLVTINPGPMNYRDIAYR